MIKLMKNEQTSCDQALLNRFMDGEVTSEEHRRVTVHLEHCPACRKALDENRRLSHLLQAKVRRTLDDADLQEIETGVYRRLDAYREKRKHAGGALRWPLPVHLTLPKRVLLPAAVGVAAVVMMVVVLFSRPGPVTSPSAIVQSFQGSVTSVMILETPISRETILWFSEKGLTQEGRPDTDNGTLGYERPPGLMRV